MTVGDVMTRGVETVRPEATVREAAAVMRHHDIGALPVCRADDRVVGMITDRDITVRASAEGRDPSRTLVEDVMTRDVVCCFEHATLLEGARLMQDEKVRRLVVVNMADRPVGIISLADLALFGDEGLAAEVVKWLSEPAEPHTQPICA